MSNHDLRQSIHLLEERDQLTRSTPPVSPNLEISEIIDRVCKSAVQNNKALLFENVSGYDIPVLTYACQDIIYDRLNRLHAIPARFGISLALRLSTICHILTTLLLATLGFLVGLGWPFWLGLLVVAGLLVYEHRLVHPDDLSHVNVAFSNINSYISITLLLAILGALYLT
jgi:hypothetical protein